MALRPKNLARRRWWSRKYPICVIVQSKAELVSGDPKLEEKINVKETPSKEETVKDDTDGTDADVDTDAVSAAESDFEGKLVHLKATRSPKTYFKFLQRQKLKMMSFWN